MKTEIINIGNELLIGQVVNTNAAWMAEQLNFAGYSVNRISVIADDPESILKALSEAESHADIILVTGGLGPTRDDITKEAICKYFQTHLIFHEESYRNIERLFSIRRLGVTELNRKQAEIPAMAEPLQNANGTAPGLWFKKTAQDGSQKTFVFMPGVPFEMKPMLTGSVIPRLNSIFNPDVIIHKTVLTQGIGESFLAAILEKWETNLPANISLAYLPQPGIVRLRLTGTGKNREDLSRQVDEEVTKLIALIPEYYFGFDEDKLEEIIGKLLVNMGKTLSTAESCTGGYIAHLITSVPGSSRYYKGTVVAYANEIKEQELNISKDVLMKHGAVSEEVVSDMAQEVRKKFGTDYSIATSGIAGPDGGTPEKPVGTTWIAVASPERTIARMFQLGDDRERNIRRSALSALNMLRKELLG